MLWATSARWLAASVVMACRVTPGSSLAGSMEDAPHNLDVLRIAQLGERNVVDAVGRAVKLVWTIRRSMSQTTSSGGFSSASRYSRSWS